MGRKEEDINLTESCGCLISGIVLLSIPLATALFAHRWKTAAALAIPIVALAIALILFARHLQFLERFIPKPRKKWKGRDEHLHRVLRKKERERLKEAVEEMSNRPGD